MDIKFWKSKVKEFWLKYEPKIILASGFILVAIVSFEAGVLKGRAILQVPLVIEKPAENKAVAGEAVQKTAPEAQNSTGEAINTQTSPITASNALPQNCAYVGSKNSNKYHLPTCSYAKRIKPENRVCFSTLQEAQSMGYLPDKSCIK